MLRGFNEPAVLNNRGFTLAEILIVAAIFSVIIVITGKFFKDYAGINRKHSSTQSIREVRDSFAYTLMAASAWDASIAHASNSPEFDCLISDPPSDCRGEEGAFNPITSEGTYFTYEVGGMNYTYRPVNNPNHGFNLNGEFCDTYSTANPDNTCPFRFTFEWEAICPPDDPADPNDDCIYPAAEVSIIAETTMTTDQGWLPINTQSLSKTIRQPGKSVLVAPITCGTREAAKRISVDPATGITNVECKAWDAIAVE